jgi:hypothetical protein
MGTINIDLGNDDVQTGFTLVPEGEYDLKIVSAELKTSKKGDPQALVDFTVINTLSYDGKVIRNHMVTFLPQERSGAWIAKTFLKSIDQPYIGSVEINTEAWIGKIVTASVIQQEYEGKMYNRINNVRKYSGNQIVKQEEEELLF